MRSWKKIFFIFSIKIITLNGESYNTTPAWKQPEDTLTKSEPATNTIHVKNSISSHTNYSAGAKQLYPATTELIITKDDPSAALFNATKFFNTNDLVDHGKLNMTKVREKFANGSTNVSPINATSARFELSPKRNNGSTDGNLKNHIQLAEHKLNYSSASNLNNTDLIHSMTNQLGQMGFKNVTVAPGEPRTRIFNSSGTIHANTTVTPSPTNTANNTTLPIETPLPENPNDPWQSDYGIIVHASVFFTNGATTPREPYPKDRYNVSFWNNELSQLTNIGKYESYLLGKWLAMRYNILLHGDLYSSRTVKVQSGQPDFVFMSAESLLAGLFPPIGKYVWNPELLWQPIPIHSVPLDQDSTVAMAKSCRQYDLNVASANDEQEWRQMYKKYENAFQYIGNNTGLSFTEENMYNNLLQAYNCYNDLKIESQYDLSLPNWTKTSYPEPLSTLAVKYLQYCTHSDTMKKYKAGPFLQSLMTNIQSKVSNHSVEKLQLYSGNAYGLSAVMNTLSVFNSIVPPFSSALLLELRQKHNQYTMTVSYKNSTNPPYLLKIANCDAACDYTKFISIVSNFIPSNWDDECNIISFGELTYSTPLLVAGLVVVIVLIFLFVLLLIKCGRCLSKRKGKISYR